MQKKNRWARGTLSILTPLLLSSAAQAGTVPGGTLTYGPLSSSAIPTLGAGALVLLAALLALAVWRMHRSGQLRNNSFLTVALVIGATSAGLGGIQLVDATPPLQEFSNPSGGSVPLSDGLNCVGNGTDLAQRVISIETSPGFTFLPGNNGALNGGGCPDSLQSNAGGLASACAEGTVLQPNGVCAAVLDITPG